MHFVRKHKKLSIIILICLVGFVLFSATLGRYIYNIVDSYILETRGFYFNSSVLSVNTKEYKINNWDGVNSYTITVDLNNRKNSFVSTESDIDYDVSFSCSSSVTCKISKASGILYQSSGTDSFTVTMTPNSNKKFMSGDSVEIYVDVVSSKPYKKTLKGKFIVSVENSNFTYNIDDASKDNFMVLNMINSVPFYEVETAFGDYEVGDFVSLEVYDTLTKAEKNNCFSALVTISFDPRIISLDMTTNSYLHRISDSVTTTEINGHTYVTGYKFKIGATSSEKIIFYKADREQNFAYPIVNSTSIVDVDVVIAE